MPNPVRDLRRPGERSFPKQYVGVAEILGVSTKSVRRYIAAGDLDAVRLGRRTIRIKTESLDRLIDAHPVNAWRVRSARR